MEYPEGIFSSNVPSAPAPEVPGDGMWHEVVFDMQDSPEFEGWRDVIGLWLHSDDPSGLTPKLGGPPADSFVDLGRIELVSLPRAFPTLAITRIEPRSVPWGAIAKVRGSGFSLPASRNAVFVGDHRVKVVSGDSETLAIRVDWDGIGLGDRGGLVTVKAPGGRRATSSQVLQLILPDEPRVP